MRLPELDEKVVRVQPLLIGGLSIRRHDVGTIDDGNGTGRCKGHVKKDALEVLVVGCDGFEYSGNPLGARLLGQKGQSLSFLTFEKSIEPDPDSAKTSNGSEQ